MIKPILYIFVGFPGAGKTTVSKAIRQATKAIHIWADHERHTQFNPVTYSQKESQTLYDRLNQQCIVYLRQRESVIYDTNFNFLSDRQLLRKIATENNAELKLIWVKTPADIARKRAVELDPSSETRILGIMSGEEFERISSHLEEPKENENPIILDCSDMNTDNVLQKVGI
jgi:predicted kinase